MLFSVRSTSRRKSSAQVRAARSRSLQKKKRPSLKERRARRRLIVTIISFVLMIGAGVGVSRLTYSPVLAIEQVRVQGNSIVSPEELSAIVKNQAAGAYLGVFSKNNMFFLPRKTIEKKITDTYKTVSRVSVDFKTMREASVLVEERTPSSLWCESADAATSACFYMDQSGYIFSQAPQFSGDVFMVYSGLIPRGTEAAGQFFLPTNDFKKLQAFVDQVVRTGLKVVSVSLSANGDGELRLATGGSILFNRNLDYTQTVENMQSIVAAQQVALRGNFLNRLDYINVRFTGKAFFKLKGE